MSGAPRVMVVDDDPELRQSVCDALEDAGYTTVAASDGAAALLLLRNSATKPQLILLDLRMPGMSGWEFRDAQVQDPDCAAIPVVVMTSERDLKGLRVNEVVHKPVKLKTLLETTARYLGRAGSHTQSPAPALARPEGGASTEAMARETVFAGGGELGQRMRSIDWSQTSLGPVEGWPQSLKTCVRIILTSRQPMFVWWGDDLINLYNDAYKSIVGGKHPEALGQPARVVWGEIWDQVLPRAQRAMRANEGTYDEALLLIMKRHGYEEETYYTFSYSPVPNDRGGTGGIICANTADTDRIIGERQLALLRELAARTAQAHAPADAFREIAAALATNARDIPFALLYTFERDARAFTLVGSVGIEAGTGAAPQRIPADAPSPWPLGQVMASNQLQLSEELQARFPSLPSGDWPRPPHTAALLPIVLSGGSAHAVLVVGLNPFRLFDARYRRFLELVSAQIASSIASSQAYEDERKRAEALAEIDRAKTTFFSNVSHEFRTPLTLMLGPTEDLLGGVHGELPAPQREQLELLRRNGRRLQKLVNALLEFSRLEAGRVQASYEAVDLGRLTRELASAFDPAVARAGLRYIVDCPPLPEPVHVDRDMWEKIVLNLLSNALKFTFEGSIEVRLRARGGRVELQVRDTGVGIAADQLPRLFERFHRIEGARARTHEGSGIGLALVQELAKLHGGTVEAQSEPGVFTAITVTIPLGSGHLPAQRVVATPTQTGPALGAAPFVEEALRWLPAPDAPGVAGRMAPPSAVDASPTPSRARASCSRTTTPTCANTSAVTWNRRGSSRRSPMAQRRWLALARTLRTWCSPT